MPSYRLHDLAITPEKLGTTRKAKPVFPVRFGTYSEIRSADYEFQFNLRGHIKSIRGLHVNWPHPAEVLKRTDGNDWIYYTVQGIRDIKKWLGEYYLPCLPYPSNSIWEHNPYSNPSLLHAFSAWAQMFGSLYELRTRNIPAPVKGFLDRVIAGDDTSLHAQSQKIGDIIGQRISVLPPDTRQVDYEIVPLMIADGCRYQCQFCCVKSHQPFQSRAKDNIREQIRLLKAFYGRDLSNYKGVFLGNHDALGAGSELIQLAAYEAAQAFGFDRSHATEPYLFLFGSVDAVLEARNNLFDMLAGLPFYTFINVGFETVDKATLSHIRKPLDIVKIRAAFEKMLGVNQAYANIEITANFLLGDALPPGHNASLTELLRDVSVSLPREKGTVYLSPMMNCRQRQKLLSTFYEIKNQSRLPVFIYLIQRL